MNLKFNKKAIFILLILCASILCIAMVSAYNTHKCDNKVNNFVDDGEYVYCEVGFNETPGCHWKVTTCEGLKFVSDKIYKSNDSSSKFKNVERFNFKKVFGDDDDHIVLTQYGPSGKVIKTCEYSTPLELVQDEF